MASSSLATPWRLSIRSRRGRTRCCFALLVVRTNVTDAFVDVAGAVGKPAHDTTTRPLVVALDERSRAEREVFVYKKGYSAYRKRHVFLAGETLELNVVLEPDAVEPVAPPTTP